MPFGRLSVVGGRICLNEPMFRTFIDFGAVPNTGGRERLVECGDMVRSHMVVVARMREIQVGRDVSDHEMRTRAPQPGIHPRRGTPPAYPDAAVPPLTNGTFMDEPYGMNRSTRTAPPVSALRQVG